MLHHSLEGEVIIIFLQHFIATALDLIAACPPDKGERQ